MTAAPFGAHAPPALSRAARRLGASLPETFYGRWAASLLLRIAGGKSRRPFDLSVFGAARARLHPYDNISEKRVFITPHFWERQEREALAAAIRAHQEMTYRFADVGANAGLYTLFASACCADAGRRLRGLCVEASSEMIDRLRFNLAASGLAQDVTVAPVAVAARDGETRFAVNSENRGESRADARGGDVVRTRPLLALTTEAGLDRLDAMKIDIEGGEHDVLRAYFAEAPPASLPKLLIVERSHQNEGSPLVALIEANGYRRILETKRNDVFERRIQA